MPDIRVTLPADYCARFVVLRVGKNPFAAKAERWEIQAASLTGGQYTTDITFNGLPARRFPTKRDAVAALASLGPIGDHAGRIWATPRERSARAVVMPAPVSGGYSVSAC